MQVHVHVEYGGKQLLFPLQRSLMWTISYKVLLSNLWFESRVVRVYKLVKINSWSLEWRHIKLERSRIRAFPFSSNSAYDTITYDPDCRSESQEEAKEQTNHNTLWVLETTIISFLNLIRSDRVKSGMGTLFTIPLLVKTSLLRLVSTYFSSVGISQSTSCDLQDENYCQQYSKLKEIRT